MKVQRYWVDNVEDKEFARHYKVIEETIGGYRVAQIDLGGKGHLEISCWSGDFERIAKKDKSIIPCHGRRFANIWKKISEMITEH